MRTIIVEDEMQAAQGLKTMLELFTPRLELLGIFRSVAETTQWLSKNEVDLVFLDIRLGDGLGMDVLRQIPSRNFEVVFTTAYSHYAIEALRLNAFDYLLKPIEPNDLEQVVERVGKTSRLLLDKKSEHIRFSIASQASLQFIDTTDVVRFESDNNYTRIHLVASKVLVVSKTLKKFEKALENAPFLRVHQRHIVNFDLIQEYTRKDGGWIIMRNGDEVPVSRSQRALVESAIELRILKI